MGLLGAMLEKDVYQNKKNTSQVQASSGYKRLTSLWSAIISSKVTEALLITASSARNSSKEAILDLNTEQVLLLSLVHSLVKKDTAACFALAEISEKVESLKSSYLNDWLQEEYTFSCNDIRSALSFAADLSKSGLTLPDLILVILENLYNFYCSPKNKPSVVGPGNPSNELHISSTDAENRGSPKPRPKYLQDIAPPKYLSTLSNKVLGEYDNYEKLALEKESESPQIIDSPLSPHNMDFPASPNYDTIAARRSSDFIAHEVSTSNMTTIIEHTSEADIINEKTGDTALHLAVAKDNLGAAVYLIKRGANVDARNNSDITPLQIAVEMENLQMIKTLCDAGANINQKNARKESLLHIAAATAGLKTIDLLIELGIDLDSKDSTRYQTPLFRAVEKGNINAVEKLAGAGANIRTRDKFSRSLLHFSAWHGQTKAVEWLLKRGLDIKDVTKHNWTPLHWAVVNRQLQTAHLLLQRGAEVNAKDTAGRTPLYWATEAGNLVLINLLTSYGGTC